jgi:TPR repeat protein
MKLWNLNLCRIIILLLCVSVAACTNDTTDSDKQDQPITSDAPNPIAVKISDIINLPVIRREAHKGDANAQLQLAEYYKIGIGVTHNPHKAVYWLKKSAAQGNTDAMAELGAAYAKGDGVVADQGKAMKLWEEAADKDNAGAELHLAWSTYRHSENASQTRVEAYKWAALVASHREDKIMQNKAGALIDMLAEGMTQSDIADAKILAEQWRAAHHLTP